MAAIGPGNGIRQACAYGLCSRKKLFVGAIASVTVNLPSSTAALALTNWTLQSTGHFNWLGNVTLTNAINPATPQRYSTARVSASGGFRWLVRPTEPGNPLARGMVTSPKARPLHRF